LLNRDWLRGSSLEVKSLVILIESATHCLKTLAFKANRCAIRGSLIKSNVFENFLLLSIHF